MPNWREPFSDVSNIATCSICHKKRKMVKIANTELVDNCACNLAAKLECGHIFVDDCAGGFNGKCFQNEAEWRKIVCNPKNTKVLQERYGEYNKGYKGYLK